MVMMLACDALRVVPVTIHIPLSEVTSALTPELLETLRGVSPEPYWKLRAKGGCQDIFFITIYDKLNALIAIMQQAADAAGYGVLPSSLRSDWLTTITEAIDEATLDVPNDPSVRTGGRDGRHSEEMGPLLAEMQHMYRSFPGASW